MTAAQHDPLRRHDAGDTLTLVLALIGACTGDPASLPVDVPETTVIESAAAAGSGAAVAENAALFRELLAADWAIEPGTERYVCARLTLTETTLVGTWSIEAPVGTHHVLLSTSPQPDGKPDGVFDCNASINGTQGLVAAGVGTPDQKLPSGVAMKLAQGAQAILNLHLFNPTDKPLRGRSGVRFQPVQEKDVREVADALNVLTLKIEVPPGRSTTHAKCTLDRDQTFVGIGPHMHEKGVALRAVAHTAMRGDVMLYDGPFDFREQTGVWLNDLQLKAGDTIDVDCTFENRSDKTLYFGDSSSDAEMCVLGVVRYPAGGASNCAK